MRTLMNGTLKGGKRSGKGRNDTSQTSSTSKNNNSANKNESSLSARHHRYDTSLRNNAREMYMEGGSRRRLEEKVASHRRVHDNNAVLDPFLDDDELDLADETFTVDKTISLEDASTFADESTYAMSTLGDNTVTTEYGEQCVCVDPDPKKAIMESSDALFYGIKNILERVGTVTVGALDLAYHAATTPVEEDQTRDQSLSKASIASETKSSRTSVSKPPKNDEEHERTTKIMKEREARNRATREERRQNTGAGRKDRDYNSRRETENDYVNEKKGHGDDSSTVSSITFRPRGQKALLKPRIISLESMDHRQDSSGGRKDRDYNSRRKTENDHMNEKRGHEHDSSDVSSITFMPRGQKTRLKPRIIQRESMGKIYNGLQHRMEKDDKGNDSKNSRISPYSESELSSKEQQWRQKTALYTNERHDEKNNYDESQLLNVLAKTKRLQQHSSKKSSRAS